MPQDEKDNCDQTICNVDLSLQVSKLTLALNEKLSKQRARDLIRDECQNMCNLFNLYRYRSNFVCLLLEQIIQKYSIQIGADIAAYKKHTKDTAKLGDCLFERANELKKQEVYQLTSTAKDLRIALKNS